MSDLEKKEAKDCGKKTEIRQKILTGERALFQAQHLKIVDTVFEDGESPLKASCDIELTGSMFKWKYPLWHSKDIVLKNCSIFEMGRAGIWYTENIIAEDTVIEAPKNFRRCRNVTLRNVCFANAAETFWNCDGVELEHVTARGDYFAMNSQNMTLKDFTIVGNYPFDGVKNAEIRHAKLLSRDAFWNCENVTVYDSYVCGEYLGWNSKNLKFVNCILEGRQGLCYIENLTLENCRLLNMTLAFESSTVKADLTGRVESVKNPAGGVIRADEIGTVILEKDKMNPDNVNIVCNKNHNFML